MSEQSAYCFYCEALRAKDAGHVHVAITEVEHKHGAESVYVAQASVGGDANQCAKFADMVRKYAVEVFGNNVTVELTPRPTGKPN